VLYTLKYVEQDQHGKASFNENIPHPTQWQGAQDRAQDIFEELEYLLARDLTKCKIQV
jgi:hypothetical protein